MMHSMFETLQGLPLLLGLSLNELVEIVEKVKFSFYKYTEGDIIVNQKDRCDKIIYILSGNICAEINEAKSRFSIQEKIYKTPYILEPENMWGRYQQYERTYTFTNDGSICLIDKRQLNYLLSNYEIVKTNYLSMICNKLQYSTSALRSPVPCDTEGKIIQFIKFHKSHFNGSTTIKIKMEILSEYISETRRNVSAVLNKWNQLGLIQLKRGYIYIPNDQLLFT